MQSVAAMPHDPNVSSSELASKLLSRPSPVFETQNPATRPSPMQSVAAMPHDPNVSPSELDSKLPSRPSPPGQKISELDSKLPSQPSPPGQQTMPNPWSQDELDQNFLVELGQNLEEMSNLCNQDEFQNFEENWKDAVHLFQSVVGAPPSQDPPDDPEKQVAMSRASLDRPAHFRFAPDNFPLTEPGAIRVSPPGQESDARSGASTPEEIGGDIMEQKPVATLSDPIVAQVVDENQELQLGKLNEAIASLQQKQSEMMEASVVRQSEMIEAKVVRAEPVMEKDNDDNERFFETYGYTMVIVCLAVGVGVLLGSKRR
jgi:hypothetical protein